MLLERRRPEIFIFLIFVVLFALNSTSANRNDKNHDSSSAQHNYNNEKHFNSHHRNHGQHNKKHKSNKQNHMKVAIGHKQYVVDKDRAMKPLGRNSRYVDKPDNRDRNPFLFQTYK